MVVLHFAGIEFELSPCVNWMETIPVASSLAPFIVCMRAHMKRNDMKHKNGMQQEWKH